MPILTTTNLAIFWLFHEDFGYFTGEGVDIIGDVVSIGNVKVRYMIKDDMMYFHRMTIFEAIGLERALILNSKGIPAINK